MKKTRRLSAPVICVGNLTMGGEGKTPIVIEIARRLKSIGRQPGIISRGYGRQIADPLPVSVSDGKGSVVDPEKGGDEPVLIAHRLKDIPIVVAANRYEAGKSAIERHDVNTIVMDDGFQHFALERDLNIVVFDATRSIDELSLFPAGRLREPLKALNRADCVILAKGNSTEDVNKRRTELSAYVDESRILCATFERECWARLEDMTREIDRIEESVMCVSAIGNPQAFEEMAGADCEVIASRRFRDHHRYTADDITSIEEERREKGARWIVTTEKDAVKLTNIAVEENCWLVARMSAAFVDDNSQRLNALLNRCLDGCSA